MRLLKYEGQLFLGALVWYFWILHKNYTLCCKFSKFKSMKIYVLVVGSFSKLNRRTINRNLTKMEINGQKLGDDLKF